MKKWLLILLMSNVSLAFSGVYPCVYFNITIKNNTANDCQLIQKFVRFGAISSATIEPTKIAAGQESQSFEMSENGFNGPDIVLTYQCGNNQIITIESQKNLCMNNGDITGSILSLSNIDATYTKVTGSYWKNKKGSIYWTFF